MAGVQKFLSPSYSLGRVPLCGPLFIDYSRTTSYPVALGDTQSRLHHLLE